MVWFYCDDCGESIKKPKLQNHYGRCSAHSFTCIDCSRVFDRKTVQSHTSCVTEKDKYVKGATKPGGFAETGFFKEKGGQGEEGGIVGEEFLTKGPDFKCTICNIWCNTWDQLVNHTTGQKHVKKTKAARARKAEEAGKSDESGKNLENGVGAEKDDEKVENKSPKIIENGNDEKSNVDDSGEMTENGKNEIDCEKKGKKRKKKKEDQSVNEDDNQIESNVKKKGKTIKLQDADVILEDLVKNHQENKRIKQMKGGTEQGGILNNFFEGKAEVILKSKNKKMDVNKLVKKILKDDKEEIQNIIAESLKQNKRFVVNGDQIELKT
eukprot:TRINITY_DN1784_c0_g4_i1.p1 TRINITY_DN1784_c0_g4~~TRINITY_DN1784_c0_g4_i1.p1  ORF type:complete len:324 (-),score=69.55 TRINITY_DN1784_c0_g4_i1:180-1151(-)